MDRTGAYAARYVAKNIVASGAACRCEVELAYAIGVARPVSVHVDTFGTGTVSDDAFVDMVQSLFDLRPARLIELFDMRSPIQAALSTYGHFGRSELDVGWERDPTRRMRFKTSYLAIATAGTKRWMRSS